MIESCTKRRMLVAGAALLVCSCLILLLEEYVEDSDFELAKGIRNSAPIIDTPAKDQTKAKATANKEPTPISRPDANNVNTDNIQCLDYKEEPTLTKNCEQCSQFEVNALQSEHCQETGYFSEWSCPKGNTTRLVPCYSKGSRRGRFYIFAASSTMSTLVFGAFVRWRKDLMNQRNVL